MANEFATRLKSLMGDMLAVTLAARMAENGYPVTPSAISYWLSGDRQPHIEAIPHIARALNCTPNDLLGVNGTKRK